MSEFDLSKMVAMQSLFEGDEPQFQKLLVVFRDNANGAKAKLQEKRVDIEACRRVCHSLKSTSAGLGFLRLASFCRDIESAQVTPANITKLLDSIYPAIDEVVLILERDWIKK